jgi:hypothetical protein
MSRKYLQTLEQAGGGLRYIQSGEVRIAFGRDHVSSDTEAAGLQDQARHEEVSNG